MAALGDPWTAICSPPSAAGCDQLSLSLPAVSDRSCVCPFPTVGGHVFGIRTPTPLSTVQTTSSFAQPGTNLDCMTTMRQCTLQGSLRSSARHLSDDEQPVGSIATIQFNDSSGSSGLPRRQLRPHSPRMQLQQPRQAPQQALQLGRISGGRPSSRWRHMSSCTEEWPMDAILGSTGRWGTSGRPRSAGAQPLRSELGQRCGREIAPVLLFAHVGLCDCSCCSMAGALVKAPSLHESGGRSFVQSRLTFDTGRHRILSAVIEMMGNSGGVVHVGAEVCKITAPLSTINVLGSVKAEHQSPGAPQPVSEAEKVRREAV